MPTRTRPTTPHLPPTAPSSHMWRLFPGCFARPLSRSCTARLKPAFALQPPSCAALLGPGIRGSNPSCAQPRRQLTSTQPQSCFGALPHDPRHGRPGKKRTAQFNSTQTHAPTPVLGAPLPPRGPLLARPPFSTIRSAPQARCTGGARHGYAAAQGQPDPPESQGRLCRGESQANRRYNYFARVADVEGQPEIAALFRSVGEGETGHAFGHFDFLKEVGDPVTEVPVGDTAANLQSAIAGETFVVHRDVPRLRPHGPRRGLPGDRRLAGDPGPRRAFPRRPLHQGPGDAGRLDRASHALGGPCRAPHLPAVPSRPAVKDGRSYRERPRSRPMSACAGG